MDEKQKLPRVESRLYARVLQLMEEERPFLDPQLNLCELANRACTNRTRLSSTLNHLAGMNFSRWLSTYRVNYLISVINEHSGKDPQELYEVAGFTSRTSFYRQFKEVTGKTPLEYPFHRNKKP